MLPVVRVPDVADLPGFFANNAGVFPQAKAKKKDNDKDTFADYKAEFKKIVWPTRIEVVKKTATVIVTSFIIGVIIFCMDTVFTAGYSAIIGLLG